MAEFEEKDYRSRNPTTLHDMWVNRHVNTIGICDRALRAFKTTQETLDASFDSYAKKQLEAEEETLGLLREMTATAKSATEEGS